MPFYNILRKENPVDRRTAGNLINLKLALDAEIPAKSLDKTLIVASWNLREFGGNKSGGLAGELVPPAKKNTDGTLASDFMFARTPYLAGFRAGWFKFTLCTQHFYYGQAKADDPQRVLDAQNVVKLLKVRMKQKDRWANNAILLGDFNVFSTNDQTFKAMTDADFLIPGGLVGRYTNAKLDKPFDQMAFLAPDVKHQIDTAAAGVFSFFDHVYREADHPVYLPSDSLRKYREWRTYKMSDHLPIWVELQIDFAGEYLEGKAKE